MWSSVDYYEQPVCITAIPTLLSGAETSSVCTDDYNIGTLPNFIQEARSYSKMVSDQGDYLYLFGGADKEINNDCGSELSNELSTLWRCQISTDTWTMISAQIPLDTY